MNHESTHFSNAIRAGRSSVKTGSFFSFFSVVAGLPRFFLFRTSRFVLLSAPAPPR